MWWQNIQLEEFAKHKKPSTIVMSEVLQYSRIESFIAQVKMERIYRWTEHDLGEINANLLETIELVYNRKRVRSILNYVTSVDTDFIRPLYGGI